MDRNDIIRMAREAGILETMGYGNPHMKAWQADVVRELSHFAALVAAAEREQFVAKCIDLIAMYGGSVDLEAAIRARGNHAND